MRVQIPAKKNIKTTNPEDPLASYYWPVIGKLYIKRLQMVFDLLGMERRHKVLDIGYGSGITFLELNKRFDEIYGIDTHSRIDLVETMLKKEGIKADLKTGDILNLPYNNEVFDGVVCISILEHLSGLSLDKAVSEIYRVLMPGGIVVFGFPPVNKKMKFLFTMIGYGGSKLHHVSGEWQILASLEKKFIIVETKTLPKFLPVSQSLYVSCKCIKK